MIFSTATCNHFEFYSGVPPSVATEKPVVKFELKNDTSKDRQELIFKCDFARVDDNNPLFYRVFWFINDYKTAIYISQSVLFHQLESTYLQNSTGLWNIKLGVLVSSKILIFFTLYCTCLYWFITIRHIKRYHWITFLFMF